MQDQNVVEICEFLIHPAIESQDQELTLLAIECIGLIAILDKVVFQNYALIFKSILDNKEPNHQKERIVALKAAVDGLIVHGIFDDSTRLIFNDITQVHLFERDPPLKQIAVEGVCKMMFSLKLCEQIPNEDMEAILVSLLVQLFDRKYNALNSLVRSLLSVFLKNFVLLSNQRCQLLLGAVTKLVCAVFSAKYGKQVKAQKKK